MFSLQIRFDENYPTQPPQIQFTTKMFHPNSIFLCFDHNSIVYDNGMICLDVIKERWSPINTIGMVLTSIQVCKYFLHEL